MSESLITQKLNHYRKQLMILYQRSGESLLNEIVEQSPIYIEGNVRHDNWNGGIYGHELTLYPNEEVYAKIDVLNNIQKITNKLREDFNQVSETARNESIDEVFIELFDPADTKCHAAIQPTGIAKINGEDLSLWKTRYIKLFISHRDKHKIEVSELAESLLPYGISCFVAHTDIEPTKEWRKEIENALRSMDIFLAYLTDDFSDGDWTNQEVGFAIACGVPIIPLKMPSKDPYGFMNTYQGLPGKPDKPQKTADLIYELILNKFDKRNLVKIATIELFINSESYFDTMEVFERLQSITKFTDKELDHIVTGFNKNDQLYGCAAINRKRQFFKFLQKHSDNTFEIIDRKIQRKYFEDLDDIPY